MGSRLIFDHEFGRKMLPPHFPYHKAKNSDSVFAFVKVLKELGWEIEDVHSAKGFMELEKLTGLKGRYQLLTENPVAIADIAHNKPGLAALFNAVTSVPEKGKLHLVFGTVKDKDIKSILGLFPAGSAYYWTESSVPRSLGVEKLSRLAKEQGLIGESYENVNDALNAAREKALPEDIIVVTGSTFVVAELDEL